MTSKTGAHTTSFLRFDEIPTLHDCAYWKRSVGGKAFFLSKLYQAGIPVPAGIVLRSHPNGGDWPEIIDWWDVEGRPAVAVRSSSSAEDSNDLSFAGQHKTFLHVDTVDGLKEAVDGCFESLHHTNSRVYRTHFGNSESDTRMNVVIQKMLRPKAAGVYFTMDPVNPEAGWLIEWVDGLGESLVSGQRTPSRIRRDSAAESEIAQKLLPIVRKVESLLEFPIDLEWAIDENGTTWVLQSRPITAWSSAEKQARAVQRDIGRLGKRTEPGTYWDGQTFAEWPGVPSELGFSLWARAFEAQGALGRALGWLGYLGSRAKLKRSALDRVLGRPYVNLRSMDELCFGKSPFATHPLPRPHLKFRWDAISLETLLGIPAAAAHMARAATRLTKSRAQWIRDCRAAYMEETTRCNLPNDPTLYVSDPLPALIAKCDAFARDFSEKLLLWPMALIFQIESSTQSLGQLIAKSVPPDEVCAVLHRQMGRALRSLTMEMEANYETACANPQSRPAYIERFGHRAAGELELSRPRWAELGERAFAIPAGSTSNPSTSTAPDTTDADFERIKSFYRPLYLRELDSLRQMLGLREHWKDHVMRHYAHIRWMALEIGNRTGLEQSVFSLTIDNLRDLDRGTQRVGRLLRAAALRTKRNEELRNVRLPAIVKLDELQGLASGADWSDETPGVIKGQAISPGLTCGVVRVVRNPEEVSTMDWPADAILVAETTDPGWTPLFLRVKGVIIEKGGALSHCAIVAREMGLPVVGGVMNCYNRLKDGQKVWVDGNHGSVQLA